MFDCGEWSQCDPDFSNLIKNFSLTREELLGCLDEAKGYADKFNLMYPKKQLLDPRSFSDPNPWNILCCNIHCIFMAGYLQPLEEEYC